jgi:hypothetical protein
VPRAKFLYNVPPLEVAMGNSNATKNFARGKKQKPKTNEGRSAAPHSSYE